MIAVFARLAVAATVAITPAAAQEHARLPYLVRGIGVDVVVVTSRTLSGSEADARLARMLHDCAQRLPLTPADSAAAVAHRSPDGWPAVTADTVAIVVLPRDGLTIRCDDQATQERLAAARGLRFTFDTTFTRDRDVRRIGVRVHSDEVTPLAAHQGAVRQVTPWGLREAGAGVQRIDLPLDLLAGDSAGLGVGLTLEISGAVEATPVTVVIPPAILDSVWTELYAHRVASAGLAPGVGSGVGPEARGFLAAIQRRNDLEAAALLTAAGDTLASRVLLERALRRDPCLVVPADADERLPRIAASLPRAPVRCTAIPTGRVALRAALLPSFGRPVESLRRPLINGAIIGGIVWSVLYAQRADRESSKSYGEYLRVQHDLLDPPLSSTLATAHFARADRYRLTARDFRALAAGIWIGSIVEAVVRERAFARYLREVGR